MDTTNPVYYQNTAETVSLDNLPTGQNNLLKHMTIPLISTDILVSVHSTKWHCQRACLSSLTETSTEALDLLNASGRALKNNYIPIGAQPYFRYNHCLTTWTTRAESLSTRTHTMGRITCILSNQARLSPKMKNPQVHLHWTLLVTNQPTTEQQILCGYLIWNSATIFFGL